MRNTGIEYSSTERTPIVLPEMAELLPPLSDEQLSLLEADILKNGCYAPVIVDEELRIVDGHNRSALCEKHGLPYRMAVFAFEDMLEAKQWALDTQKGRRNLEPWELGKIALKLKPDIEARAKTNLQEYHGNQYESGPLATLPKVQKESIDTRKELAEAVGLGERTMGKVMQIDEHAPDTVKEALDKGELTIHQGYNITRDVKDLPEAEREDAAQKAVEYEKAKKELRKTDAEIDRKTKIAKHFCTAFEKAHLLDPSLENISAWTECTRMTLDEMLDTVKAARELAEVFEKIADIVENEILPADWRSRDGEEIEEVESEVDSETEDPE
ncbi:MAG TPA: hypothetical protein PKB13_06245 [Clostridia bacterium]|nr:hypothetical protein [Clostridia bacterium]